MPRQMPSSGVPAAAFCRIGPMRPSFFQPGHAVPERPDPRQHQRIGAQHLRRSLVSSVSAPKRAKACCTLSRIGQAVINDRHLHTLRTSTARTDVILQLLHGLFLVMQHRSTGHVVRTGLRSIYYVIAAAHTAAADDRHILTALVTALISSRSMPCCSPSQSTLVSRISPAPSATPRLAHSTTS